MADVEQTDLPGVGTRYDFTTRAGERVGILLHNNGRRDLLLYDRSDPDTCRSTTPLDEPEARTMSELLGGPRLLEQLHAVRQQVEGLAIEWLRVEEGAVAAGSTLRDAAVHSRTGVSIVAIVRGHGAILSPGAEERLMPGDLVVAVGTTEGVDAVATTLRGA